VSQVALKVGGMWEQVVLVDGDDTLWATEELYQDARRACSSYLTGRAGGDGLPVASWWALQAERDLELAASLGLSPQRFPASCLQAAQQWAAAQGVSWTEQDAREVRARAEAVFKRTARVDPAAALVLAQLRQRAGVVLLTQGDVDVQRRRVDDSGLGHLVDRVVIVRRKSPALFAGLARDLAEAVEAATSIGNSARCDIAPALDAGLSAVWLHQAPAWAGEQQPLPDHPRLQTADGLAQVPRAVERVRGRRTNRAEAGASPLARDGRGPR
jgi:putative hydrolase of the HAD superfamily